MELADHLATLADEAAATNARRVLVLEGDRSAGLTNLLEAADTAGIELDDWTAIGSLDGPWRTLDPAQVGKLLGQTIPGLLIDLTDALRPNVIGRSVGAVDGGGLIILLIDDRATWIEGPLASDDRFAVVPYTASEVGTRFRRRFFETLTAHRGVSIADAETGNIRSDGSTGAQPPPATCAAGLESDLEVDPVLLQACVTPDQRACVRQLRHLDADDVAVVEAHRGRGKSAAAGIAAAGFAKDGATVSVVGPGRDAVEEVFTRAAAILDRPVSTDPRPTIEATDTTESIAYHRPHEIETAIDAADVLFVDEAAAIPVDRLRVTLEESIPVAYLSTVHGYEGTGRGFSVRFRDDLERSGRQVTDIALETPIRYRQGDPVESWQFRALLLDASPPVEGVVEHATPETVEYVTLDRDALVDDEALLRELVGLLVLAHYRTEPDDVVRLLDAPNVSARALLHKGHPVSVAMLAEEGGLDEEWRSRLYAGESIRGHMLPDLLTTQLRDRSAGAPAGLRVLRIATHDAVRSRGLGTALLESITDEFTPAVDWIGAGFGVTPRLLSFWFDAGFAPIHLGTSRNPRSGEHSAVVFRDTTPVGTELLERHERRLAERLPGQLPDALAAIEPATIETLVRGIGIPFECDLPAWMWETVEAAARGPGQVATAPEAFARLTLAGLAAGVGDELTATQRDLVVWRCLQAIPVWDCAERADLTLGDTRAELRAAIDTLWTWYQNR